MIGIVVLVGAIIMLGGATVYAGRKLGWEEILLPAIMLGVVLMAVGLVWVALGSIPSNLLH